MMELQSNPNSLAYCVLEAKYFPNWDFVDAPLGKRPSYTWRSIMAAQHIVRLGVRWRVGNGKNIQIWADRWLPTPSTFKVIKPQNTLGDYAFIALVSDLIDSSLGAWKTELVRKFFFTQWSRYYLSLPPSWWYFVMALHCKWQFFI